MKTIGKILKKIAMIVLILIVVLILGRNFFVKTGAQIGLKVMTGLTLKIDKLDIGLISTKLDIQGLRIYNPKGYEDRVMLDLPKIYVDYALMDILKGKIHLNDVKFFMNELLIVQQADGSSNLDGFKKLAAKKSDKKPANKKPAKAKEKKPLDLQIDLLEIKVGKLVSKKYSKPGKADVNEIKLDIDESYENLTDPAIVAADMMKYVGSFLIQSMMNIGLDDLSGAVQGTFNSVGKLGLDSAKKVTDLGVGVVGEAGKTLKNTADGVKNILKLPFGKR